MQQENPRSFVLHQFPDLGLETNQYKNLILRSRWQQNHLTNLLNPSLIAKVLVISSFPSYQYNEQIKTIVPQFVYLYLLNGKITLVGSDFNDRFSLCLFIVNDQIEKALKYAPHTDWSTFKSQYINPINNAILGHLDRNDLFLIGLNERWHTIWQGIQEYEYMKEHGTSPYNNTKITPEKLDEFSKKLKYLIYDIEGDYPPSFLYEVDKKMKIYYLEAKKKLPPSTSPKAMSKLLQDYDLIVKWHNRYAWHGHYLERDKLKNYIELLKLRYTINTSIIKALFKGFINS